jgi:5-methylcytosine-specific restriction endonuclease McrA
VITCSHCHKSKEPCDFEFYHSLNRHSKWCRRCKVESYKGFQKSARKRGPAGDAMRAYTEKYWRENDWRCVYCGEFLTPQNITEDHVKSLVKGGTGDMYNIDFACRSCNSSKQDRPIDKWKGGEI